MKKSPAKTKRKNGKQPTEQNPNAAGRPSLYTPELAAEYCERLRTRSQRKVCADPDMPDHTTIARWERSNPEFARECARSISARADYMADLIYDTAQKVTPFSAPAGRVKLSAYQWLAEKLDHNKYGSRSTTALTGADGGPIQVKKSPDELSDAELVAIASRGRAASAEPEEGAD